MHKDSIPTNNAELSLWAVTYKMQIGINGEAIGLTKEEIKNQQGYCDVIINAVANGDTQTKASLAANKHIELLKVDLGGLRKAIAHLKTNPLITENIKDQLGIAPTNDLFNSTNYKGQLTAEIYANTVRLKFIKHGADGVNIYHRKKGTPQWVLLGRFTKSPYDDHITLTTPNQPEHWEYRSLGVVDDSEIGQPSDIIEILFGG